MIPAGDAGGVVERLVPGPRVGAHAPEVGVAWVQLEDQDLVVAQVDEPVAVDDVLHAPPGDARRAELIRLLRLAQARLEIAEVDDGVLDLVDGGLQHLGHPRRGETGRGRALGVESFDHERRRLRREPVEVVVAHVDETGSGPEGQPRSGLVLAAQHDLEGIPGSQAEL